MISDAASRQMALAANGLAARPLPSYQSTPTPNTWTEQSSRVSADSLQRPRGAGEAVLSGRTPTLRLSTSSKNLRLSPLLVFVAYRAISFGFPPRLSTPPRSRLVIRRQQVVNPCFFLWKRNLARTRVSPPATDQQARHPRCVAKKREGELGRPCHYVISRRSARSRALKFKKIIMQALDDWCPQRALAALM